MEIRDNEIHIGIAELITDDTIKELCKHAIFSELLAEFLCKTLVAGECQWDDAEDYNPWYMISSSTVQPFEKARQEVAKLVDPITQKLVADLTAQRDKSYKQAHELRQTIFALKQQVGSLQDELRVMKHRETYA